jgi:hypothetical protein
LDPLRLLVRPVAAHLHNAPHHRHCVKADRLGKLNEVDDGDAVLAALDPRNVTLVAAQTLG